jgi:glyoxylase-like metal-dependent hydrolase (beta-lactamase superfamily II)
MSPLYPRGPVDVSHRLHALPDDGSVPHMPGWRWVHTPGHTPGHVSLWREEDRSLVVGDAFVTTSQESVIATATQAPELHGPPMHFTQDFVAAGESVRALAALRPELVITGHGRPMAGETMRAALDELAERFEEVAVPEDGRYVRNPARPD